MSSDLDPPVNFDLERMKASLASGVVSFPRGLGRARRQFLRDDNKVLGYDFKPSEYNAVECVRGLLL